MSMSTTTSVEYEPVIGLEVHAQLLTRSKMFCGCAADYQNAEPNTRVCPVCMGMPGVLPVINKAAVEAVMMTGLALNCTINENTKFDRKNYPYPDLMKGYQVSQYETPIASKGWLEVDINGQRKRVGITRAHLEEDTAKLQHLSDSTGETYSLIDMNRAGSALMEIVGEPDIRSAEEARLYMVKLRSILQYLGVSTGNMQEGSFRCDANVSVRPKGQTKLPSTKVEVKNMNSFRAVFRALEYEIVRQSRMVDSGQRVVQETRGWNEGKAATVSQRSKEYAHDYRYFPEPDLPPMVLHKQWVNDVRDRLPELPEAKSRRFQDQYGLSPYDAGLLTASKAGADFFESSVNLTEGAAGGRGKAKGVANWMLGEMARLLNAADIEMDSPELKVKPTHVAELVGLLESKTVNQTVAKEVFEETFKTGKAPAQIVREQGRTQISQAGEMSPIILEAINSNPQAVADYRKGKETAIKFLVGQVMKTTKGRANPNMVQELLKAELDRAALS